MIPRIRQEIAARLRDLQSWVQPRVAVEGRCKWWEGQTYWSKKYNKEKTLQCTALANKSGYCRGHEGIKVAQ